VSARRKARICEQELAHATDIVGGSDVYLLSVVKRAFSIFINGF